MKKWLNENETIIGISMLMIELIFLFCSIFYAFAKMNSEEQEKIRCYETYITDNVILKECKSYFETLEEE